MLDRHIAEFRQRTTPPWDNLRERRVLREIERRFGQRRSSESSRRRALVLAVPLTLTVAALLTAYFVGVDFGKRRAGGLPGLAGPPVATSVTGSASESPAAVRAPAQPGDTMRLLADGTQLELSRGARVQVWADSETNIALAQDEGRVRYRVPPLPGRSFVVFARGVQVHVKGTIFVVDVDSGKVSVQVEQGLVRVAASSGQVELGVGDELSVPADRDATGATPSTVPSGVEAAPPRAGRSEVASRSASALLERADAQRLAGDLSAAAVTLRELVARYPADARAALAFFTLGKVERARDHAEAAAKAFQASGALASPGPMSEDALAEEALAWGAAKNALAARSAAAQYAKRYPNGTHAARLQRLLE
ncbi:MAG: FecR domain-containing protein [Myxococcota bacterium]|nr:FecR domain-containing protein [Myxococcota bacterium]